MKTQYHIKITKEAVCKYFSNKALREIIIANICQDRIQYQLNHDHIHFDGNAFDTGFEYIAQQEALLQDFIQLNNYSKARKAFGRMTHSWQDFYSHSNYVRLWLEMFGPVTANEIEHNNSEILNHPDLSSGKNYGLIEIAAMIPGISKYIKPFFPPDSHAQINLDSPESGPEFVFAYWAAKKCTEDLLNQTFNRILSQPISLNKLNNFRGQPTH